MFNDFGQNRIRRVGFILLPEFSMIAFAAAIEPLRLANRVTETDIYQTRIYSADGRPTVASNGVAISVDGDFDDCGQLDAVFVCSGLNIKKYVDKPILNKLRRMASHGMEMGAVCTGAYVLARAGLLDGHQCTLHWENMTAFREEFPELDVTTELYEIDNIRATCAGGTASMDMMLTLISLQVGYEIANRVSDQLIHHRIREGHEDQRMDLRNRIGVAHPKLIEAIALMEANLEEPMNCTDLAKHVGLSTRQLERLFGKYLNYVPTKYYLELRLSRARYLLLQSSLPILDVALASGFVSASHFSKCYRERYRRTPSEERGG